MRQNIVDKIAHHIKVRRFQKRYYVDAAVINQRLFILPGEIFHATGLAREKSAEVIIVVQTSSDKSERSQQTTKD